MPPSLVGLTSATLADQAYEALREAIVAGELPRGEKITERGLAERLQVSPTPVREALRRLEQDRLIERTGPRSIRVADFDDTDLVEVTAIEDTLRALAARMAAVKATDAQLAQMRSHLDAADALHERVTTAARTTKAVRTAAEQIFMHVRAFHGLIDEAAGSALLQHMLSMVEAFDANQRRQYVRQQVERGNLDGLGERYPEHREILEALEARDEDRAEQLMLAHCRKGSPPRVASAE